MPTFAELSQLPRRERRPGIVEYLSQVLQDSRDLNVPREAVYEIIDLGSRWKNDIFELARSEETPEQVRHLLVEYVKSVTGRSFDITAKGDGLQRQEVGPLVRALQRCRVPRQRCYLTVNFLVPHVTVTSLALIATWAEKNANTIEFAYPKKRARRIEGFLNRTGLTKAIGNSKEAPAFHFDEKGHFAFLRLEPESADAEAHATQIGEAFTALLAKAPEIREGLVEVSRVLIDNVLKHSKTETPTWLFISHHPKPAGVDIAVCDLGVGLRQALKESENEELAKSAAHECDWLAKVVEAGDATASLRRVREICREHAGKMLIVSGGASYQLTVRRTAKGELRSEENTVADRFEWEGALIGVHLTQESPEDQDEPESKHDITDKGKTSAEKQAEEERHESEATAMTEPPPPADTPAAAQPAEASPAEKPESESTG
ncbi:MAG: hypothetical protein ACF8NJ_08055 [Phycisphaerales bacterium JB038]